MKNRSKALLLALCALMLVVTTVFTTLAYLTDDVTITNTFTIGNVDITLTETDVDAKGDVVNPETRVSENQSYKLFPGKTYKKDPLITVVAGSEDAYVFVRVVDEIAAIEGATTVANQLIAKKWVKVAGETDVYKLQIDEADVISKAGDTLPVFDSVTISSSVKDLTGFNEKKIIVTAYAVQAEGFDTADEAWAAAKGELTA